jgi:hypothetical protein
MSMPSAERARIGQYIGADPIEYPDLKGQRLLITEVLGSGDDTMYAVRGDQGLVTGLGGRLVRYVRADETVPAPAPPGERPRVVEDDTNKKELRMPTLEADVLTLANRYHEQGDQWGRAARKAGAALITSPEKDAVYRGLSPREPVLSLSSRSSANEIRAEVQRLAQEKGCTLEEATDMIVSLARAAKFKERVMTLTAAGLDATTALLRASQESPADAEHYRAAGLL